jgi:prefoldin alpha subunit
MSLFLNEIRNLKEDDLRILETIRNIMGKQTTLNLNALSVEQLKSLKEQLDQDITSLERSYQGLSGARSRFHDSRNCLEQLKTSVEPQQQTILVPLTASLYVVGKLASKSHALVDVGTGYYLKQPVGKAQEFFTKRANQMTEAMENIARSVAQKQRSSNSVLDAIQSKQRAYQQARAEAGQQ